MTNGTEGESSEARRSPIRQMASLEAMPAPTPPPNATTLSPISTTTPLSGPLGNLWYPTLSETTPVPPRSTTEVTPPLVTPAMTQVAATQPITIQLNPAAAPFTMPTPNPHAFFTAQPNQMPVPQPNIFLQTPYPSPYSNTNTATFSPFQNHHSPFSMPMVLPWPHMPQPTLFQQQTQGIYPRSVTSPFVKELLDYEIPNSSKLPTLKPYNGTTDPDSHIDTYEWHMTSLKLDERFWCIYFPTTLEGNAGTWFKTLRPGTIHNFNQLKQLFLTNFMQLRRYRSDNHAIIGCKQREGETVKDYFRRFTKATLDVPGQDESLVTGAFTWGLLPGDLSKKFLGKPPQSRHELKKG